MLYVTNRKLMVTIGKVMVTIGRCGKYNEEYPLALSRDNF